MICESRKEIQDWVLFKFSFFKYHEYNSYLTDNTSLFPPSKLHFIYDLKFNVIIVPYTYIYAQNALNDCLYPVVPK